MRVSPLTLLILLLTPLVGVASDTREKEPLRVALSKLAQMGIRIDTIVLSGHLAPSTRIAAAELRNTVEQSTLAPVTGEPLPRNQLLLGNVDVAGMSATVSGTLGAILNPDPRNLFGCGSGITFRLHQSVDGEWAITNMFELTC